MSRELILFGSAASVLIAAGLLLLVYAGITIQTVAQPNMTNMTNVTTIENQTGRIASETESFNPEFPIKGR